MTQVIGIIGGIGCGKSAVAMAFVRNGGTVFNADRAGYLVLHDPSVKAAALERWGQDIFTPNGDISRKKLAAIVFSEPSERTYLNQLVHPRITEHFLKSLDRSRCGGVPLYIVDAPLLLETGLNEYCDTIVYVDTNIENRWNRVRKRGWTRQDFELREKTQISLEEKRKKADFVIDNNSTFAKMEEQVDLIIEKLSAVR